MFSQVLGKGNVCYWERKGRVQCQLCSRTTAASSQSLHIHTMHCSVRLLYTVLSATSSYIDATKVTLKTVLYSFMLWVWVPWHMWRHKRNVWESVFSSHHVGTCFQAWWHAPLSAVPCHQPQQFLYKCIIVLAYHKGSKTFAE